MSKQMYLGRDDNGLISMTAIQLTKESVDEYDCDTS
jgi:hypothetical protein